MQYYRGMKIMIIGDGLLVGSELIKLMFIIAAAFLFCHPATAAFTGFGSIHVNPRPLPHAIMYLHGNTG